MSSMLPGTVDERRAFASWVASHRALITKNCARCGESFDGIKTRLYCSVACRVAAHRARRAASTEQQ